MSTQDYLNSRAGARKLARTINAFWQKHGRPWVRAYEVQEPFGKDFVWTVRSNMSIVWSPSGYQLEKAESSED